MHIELLVEEPSAEAALNNLVPKILPGIEFEIRTFQSKDNLLSDLPKRLKGYYHWLPEDWRIAVLIDEDRQDCNELKEQLEDAAAAANLITKSKAGKSKSFQVLNRIVIEELEAWFFGDVEALVTAYPGVPDSLANKEKYRDPDAIKGGTWEALLRILQKAGHYQNLTYLPKIETARNISQHMDPERNRSKSFQVFKNGLLSLADS